MTQEQLALTYGDQILAMIGPHGIFAILGSIFVVRAIVSVHYFERSELLILNAIVSALIGAGSVYFFVEGADLRLIAGGSFMTPIGAMVVYEVAKFILGALYEKTGMEIFRVAFFFLTPKPIRSRNGKPDTPPHPTLTQFFDRTRVDK